MNTRAILVPLVLMMTLGVIACDADDGSARPRSNPSTQQATQAASNMKINLKLQDETLTARLFDTPTARDFASMLPLTLTLEDYASAEKISYLPRKLTTEGAAARTGGSAGAIAYYAPWGNVALFYKDFRPADGLILIGQLDGGVETVRVPGAMKVTIALVGEDDPKRNR
jgi:hypothetical protein